MPVISYPEDLGVNPAFQNYVLFVINTRVGAPELIGSIGGAGPQRGLVVGSPNTTVAAIAPTTRLDTAIALHIDSPPETQYSATYSDVDLGGIGNLAKLVQGEQTIAEALRGIATKAAANMATATANQAASSIAKVRLNPFKQVFFEHMRFRELDFSYKFFPKSPGESARIKNIIDLFKFHMHPSLSSGQNFMIYPSEFDILYYSGEQENNYWHRISTSVLLDLNVKYGGETFSAFDGGKPVEIYLTLKFRELEALTKERIASGY